MIQPPLFVDSIADKPPMAEQGTMFGKSDNG